MLETLVRNQVIFYAMGATAAIGIASRLIAHVTLRRLARAAGKMNKSSHKFMRLVKAKFEHAMMVSDRVENVEAFLKKYVYEYRVFRVRLWTWLEMEKKCIGLFGMLGAAGTAAAYYLYGADERVIPYAVWTAVGTAALLLAHLADSGERRLQVMENYMIDFLENVFAHRCSKMNPQKNMRQNTIVQMEEAFQGGNVMEKEVPKAEEEQRKEKEEDIYAMEEAALDMQGETEKEKISQEVRIREILEEFLA